MDCIHGTCSNCGGPVTTPSIWGATVPPIPTCKCCGATPKQAFGPVIDMNPRPSHVTISDMAILIDRANRNGTC